jgi:hypothetical protein
MEPQFNKFVTFTISPEEELVAHQFHPLNMAHIQNCRAEVAEEILTLRFDPINPLTYGLTLAEKQGQLLAYEHLINLSNQAREKTSNADSPNQEPTN